MAGPLPYLPGQAGTWPDTFGRRGGSIRGRRKSAERVLDKFTKESGTVRLTLVEPVVVEVSADVAWSGSAFRHSVHLVRVRPELHPADVIAPAQMGQED